MLTSQKLDQIRVDMKLALSMVESTHNLEFEIGKMTYGSHTFKVTLEAAIGKDGEEADLAKTKWDKECYSFGLKRENFGKKFKLSTGVIYTIVDIRPRSTKYPIIAEDSSGASFKFRATTVKMGLINDINVTIEEV